MVVVVVVRIVRARGAKIPKQIPKKMHCLELLQLLLLSIKLWPSLLMEHSLGMVLLEV